MFPEDESGRRHRTLRDSNDIHRIMWSLSQLKPTPVLWQRACIQKTFGEESVGGSVRNPATLDVKTAQSVNLPPGINTGIANKASTAASIPATAPPTATGVVVPPLAAVEASSKKAHQTSTVTAKDEATCEVDDELAQVLTQSLAASKKATTTVSDSKNETAVAVAVLTSGKVSTGSPTFQGTTMPVTDAAGNTEEESLEDMLKDPEFIKCLLNG